MGIVNVLKGQRADPAKRRVHKDIRDIFKFSAEEIETAGIRQLSQTELTARGFKNVDGALEWSEEVNALRWEKELSRSEIDALRQALAGFQGGYDIDDDWLDEVLDQLDRASTKA